jgi:hypothetical protein
MKLKFNIIFVKEIGIFVQNICTWQNTGLAVCNLLPYEKYLCERKQFVCVCVVSIIFFSAVIALMCYVFIWQKNKNKNSKIMTVLAIHKHQHKLGVQN